MKPQRQQSAQIFNRNSYFIEMLCVHCILCGYYFSMRRPKFYPETNNPKIVKRVPMTDISVKRSFKKTAAAITVITGIT